MADPNIIFALDAINPNARTVCLDPRNATWSPQPLWLGDDDGSIFSSREPTPLHPTPSTRSQLLFTFGNEPKDTSKGFAFGSDERKCDVVIGKKRDGISGCHFYITIDAEDRVILRDTSTRGTRVTYDGQGNIPKTKFQWVIFPEYNIRIIIGNLITEIQFELQAAEPKPHDRERRALLDTYLEKGRNTLPLNLINVQSQETTAQPSRQNTSSSSHIYIKDNILGAGGFGQVYRVRDVSSGKRYAGKEFYTFLYEWKQEVNILQSIYHDHIVRFVDFVEEIEPMLVTEFLPMGNLAAQHDDVPLSDQDSFLLCYQLLQALQHVHSLSITHRDIKPQNILVKSRKPFHVQLADFGFAKYGSTLFTYCGTDQYIAPEVYDQKGYTSIADIWSLGVVVFEFMYGIPDRFVSALEGKARCGGIVAALKDCEWDPFLAFLSKLVQMDYRRTLTASESLEELDHLNLPGEGPFNLGHHAQAERESVERVGSPLNVLIYEPLPFLSQLEELPAPQLLHTIPRPPAPERQHTRNPPLGFNEYVSNGQLLRECLHNNHIIRLRVEDKWICLTSMAEAAGKSRQWVSEILSKMTSDSIEHYHHKGQKKRGTLMESSLAMMYARDLGVSELIQWLLTTNTSENMIFSVRGHSIWVLPSRQKINALQLAIAVGLDRQKMRRALKRLNITCLEYNRSLTKCATGTYVNFDDGLELWRDFGLEPCPLFHFMMDHQSPDSMPNSESRLTRRKGQDGELVSDREAQNGQDEEEDFEERQFDQDFEADFENEGRE